MKHLEASKRIRLTREVTEEDLKKKLLERLRRALDVDSLSETKQGFHIEGTTGGPESVTRHACVDINVEVYKHNEMARIFVYGYSKMARSLLISYVLLFLMVLLVGLLPGSIETSGDDSGPLDALVLLLFGTFIFYDISRKVDEPKEFIESVLESLETEFG